ncbi:MAG TPA: hypothetical protein VFB35_04500 [Gaiellaceae bacterium]|nr:hypothetical protein [Gaiellaceae bacterium]
MYPHVVQFETRQMELEAQLGLYGQREALAQRSLEHSSTRRTRRRRLRLHLRPVTPPEACEC